jgi:hypothetical protein
VPVAPGGWVARLLRMAARQVLDARAFTLLALGAVSVTLALSLTELPVPLSPRVHALLPHPGVWAATLALGLVMVGYGELLRRGSQGDWTSRPHVGLVAILWRALLCLGAGTALVLPLIIAVRGDMPPRVTRQGLAIALGTTLLLPLVMLATYYPSGSFFGRLRVIGSMLRRHPKAVLASLLILPLSLIGIEALLIILTRATFTFPFLVLDLFPERPSIIVLFRVPYYMPSPDRKSWIGIMDASDTLVMHFYGDSLRHGYTLLGAIPASLALGTLTGYDSVNIWMWPEQYLAFRMFLTLLIVTAILSVLAIQARWLGLLSTIDARRNALEIAAT